MSINLSQPSHSLLSGLRPNLSNLPLNEVYNLTSQFGQPGFGFPAPTGPNLTYSQPGHPQQRFPRQIRRNLTKEAEFAKGLYVYNFEQITIEILFNHFNKIKPVAVIKFPKTKDRHSKRFAFVYFYSKEDANFVRETIQRDTEAELQAVANGATEAEIKKLGRRHKILLKPIKVASLNLNQFSKLLLKPKAVITNSELTHNSQNSYFNEFNLEKEIKRLIPDSKFNRVIIPRDQNTDAPLPYARAYFDLENRDEIEFMKSFLEADETFRKNVEVFKFLPVAPSASNTLYVKGLTHPGEEVEDLTYQLREFFKNMNPEWRILSVYTSMNEKGAWGNVSFGNSEECKDAFERLKVLDVKFRGRTLFANIKNQSDARAVIIYDLKSGVQSKEIEDFFKDISDKSAQVLVQKLIEKKENEEESKIQEPKETVIRRMFNFYDLNILEEREVEKDGRIVVIPRRLVITFLECMNTFKMNELVVDIKLHPKFSTIFNKDFSAKCLKPFKLAGHIGKNDKYITHKSMVTERKGRSDKLSNKLTSKTTKKPFNPLDNISFKKEKMLGASPKKRNLVSPNFIKGMQSPNQRLRQTNPLIAIQGLNSLLSGPLGGNSSLVDQLLVNPLSSSMLGNPSGNSFVNPFGNPFANNPLCNPLFSALNRPYLSTESFTVPKKEEEKN